ncbi:MAG TPA: sulfite exporter TauE/SafE family protein [Chitinophagaceae bacterium]|nr:MAG: putative permease [Bacteroidetes bacterium OLB11]HMN31838.1 sulfite exporter TauE/SafE family protein [Chitinophagaceae bacterium]
MELIGYFAAILIGISLGLIGGGGSILSVPVLVYLFGIEATLATTYSLFIVGITSLLGVYTYVKKDLVEFKTVLFFGIPSIISVFVTKAWITPSIPTIIFQTSFFTLSKNELLMLLFAVLMLFASISMIKQKKNEQQTNLQFDIASIIKIIIQGLFVGMITGLVGAGGGFIIIPVLVNLFHIPMKKAVGTSLLIIAINSLSGFFISFQEIAHWQLIFSVTSVSALGIFIGSYLSNFIDGKKLKKSFGWFVLIMGIYIILKETVL